MSKLKVAVYPGSFDPPTLGHIEILHRLTGFFDQVVVLIAVSPGKKCLFSVEERMELLKKCTGHIQGVRIDSHLGLTVDYLKMHNLRILVRGLRTVSDFEYEKTLSQLNTKLFPEVETFLVYSSPQMAVVSSSAVREIASYGGSLQGLVPQEIEKLILEKAKLNSTGLSSSSSASAPGSGGAPK